jgi:hypothetical protein
MTRILTALVLAHLTGSAALAEDGSGAIACVLDEADNVFLVSSDALSAVDDGEVVELVAFDTAPTGLAISEEVEDDGTLPEACSAAEGIYRSMGEGVALTFDDQEAAAGLARDEGEVVEVEEVEPFFVSMYDHTVFEDLSGGLISTQTQAPFYLSLGSDRMQISKPVYRTPVMQTQAPFYL